MMQKAAIGSLAAVFLLFFAGLSHAQGTATATYVRGKVEAVRGGGAPVQIRRGHVLTAGDRIQTGRRATVELRLDDGAMVKLGERTSVDIVELTREASGKKTSLFKILLGRVRALITQFTAKRDRFELQGPTAVAGVSGSDLGAHVLPEDEAYFGFFGKLYSAGADGKRAPLPIRQVVRYKGGKKVEGPIPMAPEDYSDWEAMSFMTPGVPRSSITSQAGVSEEQAIMGLIDEMVDIYERRRITAFMRYWNDERFRAYNQLEQDIESDFELLRDLRLLYKNARLSLAPGGRAIFEADWEKRYLIRGNLSDQQLLGRMQLLLEKERGKWMISGMSGARIFGSTQRMPDLAAVRLEVLSSSVTASQPVTLRATIQNLTRRSFRDVVVRFMEGSRRIGADQRISIAGLRTEQASVSWTPGSSAGTSRIQVEVNPDQRPPERNRANNVARTNVTVKAPVPVGYDAVITANLKTVTFSCSGAGGDYTLTSLIIYVTDLDQAGKGTVNVTISNNQGDEEVFTLTERTSKNRQGIFKRNVFPYRRYNDYPFCLETEQKNSGRLEWVGCDLSFQCQNIPVNWIDVEYIEPLAADERTDVRRTLRINAN